MESYEIELNNKIIPIKPCRNLCGHSIEPYKIHAGKSVPIIKNNDNTKMEENEQYAIETFATTGKGYVWEDGECSHYMKDYTNTKSSLSLKNTKAKNLLAHIDQAHSTLAFCRRWLDRSGHTKYYHTYYHY
jgi:methionyl aminopeptidase